MIDKLSWSVFVVVVVHVAIATVVLRGRRREGMLSTYLSFPNVGQQGLGFRPSF